MRILLLSTYFRPDIASTGVLMTQLAEDLTRLGHEVTVLTTFPHYDVQRTWDDYRGRLVVRERHEGMDVYRLYTYVPNDKTRFLGRLLSYLVFNALSAVMGTGLPRHDVILVPSPPLTNGLSADVIGRLRRTPFVYNVQDIWPDVVIRAGVMTGRRAVAASRRLERYVYRRAAAVSVISEGFRRNLTAKGVPGHKLHVIPNFFDTDFIRPLPRDNSFRMDHGLDGKFVVLFAGNIGHSQGLETVLEAARRLSDLDDMVFLIVGNGAAKPALEARAARLDLRNVRFLPYQPHEVLPFMYAASDICLVPLRRGFTNESVPSKVYSIMAAGRPMAVSVDEGSDTWELVRLAECGLWTQPEDAGALAGAIRTLYADPDLREQMGRNGRRYVVDHHTRQTVARRYHELLTSVAGR